MKKEKQKHSGLQKQLQMFQVEIMAGIFYPSVIQVESVQVIMLRKSQP